MRILRHKWHLGASRPAGAGDVGYVPWARLAVALAAVATMLVTTASPAHAATHTEVGDAPSLVPGQTVTGADVLTSISGTVAAPDQPDLYRICVTGPFSATTVGSATFDTQLFLFTDGGAGVANGHVSNDDAPVGNLRSTIPSSGTFANGGTITYTPGPHYLAVSGFDNDPRDADGDRIFPNTFGGVIHPEAGAGPLASWSGGGATGDYTITLTGAATFDSAQCSTTTVSIADVTVTEGDSGSAPAAFTVSLSGPVAQPVTVKVTTAAGTAASGSDYVDQGPFLASFGFPNAQNVTIPAGQTSGTYNRLSIFGDLVDEANETFTATLAIQAGSSPDVVIGDGSAVATITDDDHVTEVTGLAPNHGTSTGGTQVTIVGHNLAQAAAVSIGGVAVPFTISGNSLVITTPAALPDTVHVVVTGPDGDSKTHSGSAYTYI